MEICQKVLTSGDTWSLLAQCVVGGATCGIGYEWLCQDAKLRHTSSETQFPCVANDVHLKGRLEILNTRLTICCAHSQEIIHWLYTCFELLLRYEKSTAQNINHSIGMNYKTAEVTDTIQQFIMRIKNLRCPITALEGELAAICEDLDTNMKNIAYNITQNMYQKLRYI